MNYIHAIDCYQISLHTRFMKMEFVVIYLTLIEQLTLNELTFLYGQLLYLIYAVIVRTTTVLTDAATLASPQQSTSDLKT